MGIGGATLSVPILMAHAIPAHKAIGTASAIGLIIALPGTAAFAVNGLGLVGRPPGSLGYISLPGAVLITTTSIFTAPPWSAPCSQPLTTETQGTLRIFPSYDRLQNAVGNILFRTRTPLNDLKHAGVQAEEAKHATPVPVANRLAPNAREETETFPYDLSYHE